MSERNTLVRSLHDLGLAGWFGGTLMGAVGLNGAANHVSDSTERASVASAGWARWAPVQITAIGAHLIGGAGLLVANSERAKHQEGVTGNTTLKLVLTGAGLAATAYSGYLGGQVAKAGDVPAEGGAKPSALTPPDVAQAQQRLRIVQWVIPAITGVIVVLGAQQGEQQKAGEVTRGLVGKAGTRARTGVLAASARAKRAA